MRCLIRKVCRCEKQTEYSDELQTKRRPDLLCGGRLQCLKKCFIGCLLLTFTLTMFLFYVAPFLRQKVKCMYHDTSSEDIGIPNFYLSCGASKEDCGYYGYKYHSSQQNRECCKKEKVPLCIYPEHPPPPEATPANHFQYLTWNVFQRPSYISQDGQVERTCHIPRWIATHYPHTDAVAFQELFSDGCWGDRSSMKEMLKSHGYLYSTRPAAASMHVHTAGVVLASKWPIVHQDVIVFGYANVKTLKNLYIPKGAVYAKVRKKVGGKEQIYHLVGLHFFSNRGDLNTAARLYQADELVEFLNKQNISKEEPVLIAGDFNQDLLAQKEEREKVFEKLSAVMPTNISRLSYSFDRTFNKLNIDANPPDWPQEWLDYVLYMSDHKVPLNATLGCVPAKTEEPMSMCWYPGHKTLGIHRIPKKSNCDTIRNYTELSDHYPAIGTFIF